MVQVEFESLAGAWASAADAASPCLRCASAIKAMPGSLGGTVLTPVVLQLGCSLGWCASIGGKMLNDGSDGLRNSIRSIGGECALDTPLRLVNASGENVGESEIGMQPRGLRFNLRSPVRINNRRVAAPDVHCAEGCLSRNIWL